MKEKLVDTFKKVGAKTGRLLVRIGRALPDIPDYTFRVYIGNDRPPTMAEVSSPDRLWQGGSLPLEAKLRHARAWESLGKALVEQAEQERING